MYYIVLYLYSYIGLALLVVHANQKRFHLYTSPAQMQWYCILYGITINSLLPVTLWVCVILHLVYNNCCIVVIGNMAIYLKYYNILEIEQSRITYAL